MENSIIVCTAPKVPRLGDLGGFLKGTLNINFMVRLNDSFEFEFYFGASSETKARAAELRRNMTVAEKVLWEKLRNNQLNGLKFRRQHPVDIFILDFYCHDRKLAIEVDGGIHIQIDQKEWDENRTYELNEFGIKVLRFTNDEVIYGTRKVIDSIKNFLESK